MKKRFGYVLAVVASAGLGVINFAQASSDFGKTVVSTNITTEEVQKAQEAWGQALISISKEYSKSGAKAAKKLAEKVIDTAYGYQYGAVLLKPTLANGDQTFRITREGALAYFVGQNKAFPDDTGFALKGWDKFAFKNAAVLINGDMAITMGNVYLTDAQGKVTTVDKTWGFKKDDNGRLRIVLHHSSLPYAP